MERLILHTDKECQLLFLDRFQGFLGTAEFAQRHGFTIEYAEAVIAQGKRVHGTLSDKGDN